jgi:hypothetical protein
MADTLELSAEEQSILDQMRADDAQSGSEAQVAQEPVQQPPEVPAQPAAPATTEQPPPPRQDMVPHQALHAEREEHKRTRSELAAERERIRTLEERTNLLLQRFGPQSTIQPQPQPSTAEAPKPPPIPDLDKDPVGHIIGRQLDFDRRLQEQGQNWQQQQAAYQQQLQAQQTLTALTQHAQAMESQFSMEHPDYPAAVAHLVRSRHQELEMAGVRNAADRQRIIQEDGLGVAARLIQIGGNPAEAIYEIARARGYVPPAPPQSRPVAEVREFGSDLSVPPVETATPLAAAPQAARAQAPTGAQRLQTLAQGQEQARSLGNARGAGPVPLTANRLVEMSQDEFAAFLDKATSEQMAEMFGS